MFSRTGILSNRAHMHAVMQAMVPYHEKFLVDAVDAVKQGYVTQERLDIAVAHVLQLKRRLGYLFNERLRALDPAGQEVVSGAPSGEGDVACTPVDDLQDVAEEIKARERAESLQAAKDGLVLVKNERGMLPLEDVAEGDVVAVVGPNADSAANLLGAWSYHWQGPVEEVWQLSLLCFSSLASTRPHTLQRNLQCSLHFSEVVHDWKLCMHCRLNLIALRVR